MSTYKTEAAARKAAEEQGLKIKDLRFAETDNGWGWSAIEPGQGRPGTSPLRPGEAEALGLVSAEPDPAQDPAPAPDSKSASKADDKK